MNARGRTAKVFAVARDGATSSVKRFEDEVIVEEPLEIRLGDTVLTTTMRTPGADFELAVGFCFAEGALDGARVKSVRYCAAGDPFETGFNVVTVGVTPPPAAGAVRPRQTITSAACGVCGSADVDALLARLVPLRPPVVPLDAGVVASVDEATRAQQPLFDATGAVHAASAFDVRSGDVLVVREDIGRHNAVDKVVGRLVLDGVVPGTGARELGLFVSGRASFEMAQKAWAAGFAWLVAVGGPSSLAVDTARRANLGLLAFARGGRFTWYSPEDRP